MRIKLEREQLNLLAEKLNGCGDDIKNNFSYLLKAYGCLDWEYGARGNTDSQINEADRIMNVLSGNLHDLGRYVSKVSASLTSADNEGAGSVNALNLSDVRNVPIGIGSCSPAVAALVGASVIGSVFGLVSGIPSAAVGWVRNIINSQNQNHERQQALYAAQIQAISDMLRGNLIEYENSWSGLDRENKIKLLQNIENEIAEIQNRSSVTVFIDPNTDPKAYMEFNPQDTKIHVTADYLEHTNFADVLKVLIHEGRHAYQFGIIQNPQYDADTTEVTTWHFNFDHYIGSDNIFMPFNPLQPVEIDANSYANRVMDML